MITTTTIITVRVIPHLLPGRVPPQGMVTERPEPRRLEAKRRAGAK
jgi:hypothetical protein